MMNPVPLWMEMAKSAYPLFNESIWMYHDPDEIDGLTAKLKAHRDELATMYKQMLFRVLAQKGPFPAHLIPVIAEYASPCASDVRVAWYDDEDQCKAVREAKTPGELQEPKPCIIM
jgi:hypothetical protein